MPFKSKAQQAYLWIHEPAVAKKFAKHTPKGAKLPKRVPTKEMVGLSSSVDSLFPSMVVEADLPWTKRAGVASAGVLLGLLASKVLGGKEGYQPPVQAKEPATATHRKPAEPSYPAPPAETPPPVEMPFQKAPLSLEEAMEFIHPNEGRRDSVYRDSVGKRTVGVGYNLDQPGAARYLRNLGINYLAVKTGQRKLTQDEITALFAAKVKDAMAAGARVLKTYDDQPKEVQLAVTDMIYNLGPTGFANLDARDHIDRYDYPRAVDSLYRTEWRSQVGPRADRVINLIKSVSSLAKNDRKKSRMVESVDDLFESF